MTMTSSTSTSISIIRERQDLAIDTLRRMKQQESGAYRIPTSHLEAIFRTSSGSSSSSLSASSLPQQQQQQKHYHSSSSSSSSLSQTELSAYLIWRRQMIEWCYRIAETCHFAKETVEIAVSLLDRYVATTPETIMLDASLYQLSCMACLYTACKTNEPTCLSPTQMERISGCRFDNQALQQMEVKILTALQWRVNPPTAIAFGRCLLDAIDLELRHFAISNDDKESILAAVEVQIEQATADELFLPIRASGIALAAVLNGLRRMQLLKASDLWRLETTLSQALGYQLKTSYQRHTKVEKLQNALLALVALSHGYELLCPSDHDGDDDDSMMMMMMEDDDNEESRQDLNCSSPSKASKSALESDYFRSHSPRCVAMNSNNKNGIKSS